MRIIDRLAGVHDLVEVAHQMLEIDEFNRRGCLARRQCSLQRSAQRPELWGRVLDAMNWHLGMSLG